MSYEPTNWKAGDTVTSAKLNKMEQGIAGGVNILLVSENEGTSTLNKTWQEIHDADVAVVSKSYDGVKTWGFVQAAGFAEEHYIVVVGDKNYVAESADGYPEAPK